ncbi:GTP pyrophosphokinase [Neotamlana laminarinivorans]|uniref:RelA/SpoT domain-containing protein n=1 Tax=Neotamlana laminarinivorans TaxID=2883124 RepID=A0A9X1L5D7_9FLAO|nr:hypothetical protein [Tamlana laminarinivorans]MCB4800292.1 hypothetical protein [Tamlana laminarinivorans]
MKSIKEYNQLNNLHKAFTLKVSDLIKSLIEQKGIKVHLIEERTKTQLSFADKITRKNKSQSSDSEITDISGIRVITYYQKDVDLISEIVKSEFQIDEKNSINKSQILKNNEFGYQSVHFVVKINKERGKLSEWISFADLNAEIQIRTVLQHSWASISHELQYKKTYEIPNILKRKLFRLAGLFELADEQFGELKENHNKIESEVFNEKPTKTVDSNNEINLITIDHFIQKSEVVTKLLESANESGFLVDSDVEKELSKKSYKQTLSDIIRIVKKLEIDKISDLEKLLESSIDISYDYFTDLIQNSTTSVWSGWRDFFTELILMSKLKELDKDYYLANGWHKDTFELVEKISRKYYS